MITVRALLAGEEFDLADLAEMFPNGEPTVQKDEVGYWLSSAIFDGLGDDITALDRAATGLLGRINGAARLVKSDFRLVALAHRYEVRGPDGVRQNTVVLAEKIEIRARAHVTAVGLTTGDSEAIPPPLPNKKAVLAIQLAETNPDVAELLDWLAGELDWSTLSKVFEIVEHAVGGQGALMRRGYAKRSAITAFTASANRPDVSGKSARHARMSGAPPRRTMTLAEGREFVGAVVDRWLDHQARSRRPTNA